MEGHWDSFRPEMSKIISRLRIYRSSGAPTIAMTATASEKEIRATINNLGFRTDPVILTSSPIQSNLKFVTLRRPSNVAGADGYEDEDGLLHPGYLTLLKRIYLSEFIRRIMNGEEVQRAIIFCRYVWILE